MKTSLKIALVFAGVVSLVSLSSCNKEKGDYFQGASQEDVLRRLEGQPCGIPERKQKCEFDKNAIDFGLSVYWSRIPLGAEYVGDYGDYYCWGNLEPSDPELIYGYLWRAFRMSGLEPKGCLLHCRRARQRQ